MSRHTQSGASEHQPCCGGSCACRSDVKPESVQAGYGVSRRSFIQTLGASAAAGALTAAVEQRSADAQQRTAAGPTIIGPEAADITLRINGTPMNVTIDPATTLMEVLRWKLNSTGTKEVCDRGACGACSVLVDGELVVSCMMLAVDAVGSEISTVEGLADADELDPIQEAFIKHDALQCGYCTPGLLMASRALLNRNPKPSLDDIRSGLSGNICRCGTYTNIFNAVLEASGQRPIADHGATSKEGA